MVSLSTRLAIACCLLAALCLGGAPARAIDTGAGSKNFSAPGGVPNYFSNEAEPFLGETAARGPVPHSTVSGSPRVHSAYARADRYIETRHGRAVRGRGGRLAVYRGGRGGRLVAYHGGRAFHPSGRVAVSHGHATARGHTVAAVSHSHAALPHHAVHRHG